MTTSAFARTVLSALVVLSASQVVSALPETSEPEPARGGRYGGYVWLDIHGRPLPFQSNAEIEDFLRTAKVVDSTIVSEGITMPHRVVLSKDGVSAHAIFKDVDVERHKVTERTCGRGYFYLDWQDSYTHDIAAYAIDQMLDLNRVPPAVRRRFKGSSGAMIIWIENTMTERVRRERGFQPPDPMAWNHQMQIMRVFNNLIARRDVNPGNTLIDTDWRVWFIDSTRAFGNVDDLLCRQMVTSCERGLFERLRSLDPDDVRQQLKPVLSRTAVSAFLERRDKLVALLLEMIEERGEENVIFDMMAEDPEKEHEE